MSFNIKTYYNKTTLEIIFIIACIMLVIINVYMFNYTLKAHLIVGIVSIVLVILFVKLILIEDKKTTKKSNYKVENLNKMLPIFDTYLHQNSPHILYVSSKLSNILSITDIDNNLILNWWNRNTLKIVETIIIVDTNLYGYSFSSEKSTKYINSIDDLYEKEN